MKTHRGSARVKAGFYWSLERWSLTALSGEGGVLPGPETHRYLKIPAALVLVLAPVMGGLYVMFLPLIGFVLIGRFAMEKAGALLARAALGARGRAVTAKESR